MATAVQHDEWCDGYAFAHIAEVHTIHPRMCQARCRKCEWTGHLLSQASRKDAERQASGHVEEVPCTGQCVA